MAATSATATSPAGTTSQQQQMVIQIPQQMLHIQPVRYFYSVIGTHYTVPVMYGTDDLLLSLVLGFEIKIEFAKYWYRYPVQIIKLK
jgi:hypothetical protein